MLLVLVFFIFIVYSVPHNGYCNCVSLQVCPQSFIQAAGLALHIRNRHHNGATSDKTINKKKRANSSNAMDNGLAMTGDKRKSTVVKATAESVATTDDKPIGDHVLVPSSLSEQINAMNMNAECGNSTGNETMHTLAFEMQNKSTLLQFIQFTDKSNQCLEYQAQRQ